MTTPTRQTRKGKGCELSPQELLVRHRIKQKTNISLSMIIVYFLFHRKPRAGRGRARLRLKGVDARRTDMSRSPHRATACKPSASIDIDVLTSAVLQ